MQFENCDGVFQVAFFGFAADVLKFTELIERFVELTGEAMAVHAEIREQALLPADWQLVDREGKIAERCL